jgi:hypothetical protein
MKNIQSVGLTQGYSLITLKRVKASLNFESCSMVLEGKRQWGWRDPSVIEPDSPSAKASLEDKVMHKLSEIERLAHAPKPATDPDEELPEGDIQADRTDESGYLVTPPVALGLLPDGPTVTVLDMHRKIDRLIKTVPSNDEIVRQTFEYAYPWANLSESVIVRLLVANHIPVPRKGVTQPEKDPIRF